MMTTVTAWVRSSCCIVLILSCIFSAATGKLAMGVVIGAGVVIGMLSSWLDSLAGADEAVAQLWSAGALSAYFASGWFDKPASTDKVPVLGMLLIGEIFFCFVPPQGPDVPC
jgi:hypothetical protein